MKTLSDFNKQRVVEAEGEEEDGMDIDWTVNDDGTLTMEIGDEEYTLSKELTNELHDDLMDDGDKKTED